MANRGFTLLELLVTMAVVAILVTVAIPSYRALVQHNAMAAAVNDLVGDLNYARSKAITRGAPVYLCKSADQATCTAAGNWQQGWIVYAPQVGATQPAPGNLLRVHGAVAIGDLTITNETLDKLNFGGNGFALGSASSFQFRAEGQQRGSNVIISMAGSIRTEHL